MDWLFCFTSTMLVSLALGTAETEDLPQSVVAEENPFRTAKMNFIWAKAVHHLTDKSSLKQLKKELHKFDTLYLTAKDRSLKYGRNDMHEVDRKLEEAMQNYDLVNAVFAYNKKMKWRSEEELKKENVVLPTEKFSDPKLNKLWQAALSSRFTEYQLKALHKEIKNYERREEVYHEMVAEFNAIPHENSLDGHEHERREQLNQDMKQYFAEMTREYDRLHEKIVGTASSAFRNEEVDSLWRMAVLSSNFSEAELESVRVELSHFDKQLDKLKFHEDELEAVKETTKKMGKSHIMEDSLSEFEERFNRLKRKLKKLEQHIETRIKHTEL